MKGTTMTNADEALDRTQREIDNRLSYVFTWMQPEEVKDLRAAFKRRDAAVRLTTLQKAQPAPEMKHTCYTIRRNALTLEKARRAYEEVKE